MIRWKYVVPRILILLTVVVVLCFSLGPLLHLAITFGGQAATGARVELTDVKVDLRNAQVSLTGLRVADPEHEQQNLFEADAIFLDVDTDAALRRKFVVNEGRVSGLRLQSGRDESGALDASEDEASESVVEQVRQRGEAWLDSSVDTLQQDLQDELHTVRLSRELRQRWPVEYERLRLRGKQIETEGQKLKDDVQLIAERPLENLQLVQPTLERVNHLRREVTDTRQQLEALRRQVQLDKDAIIEAKEHDVVYVREKMHIDALDAESLNDYLLGPVWSQRVVTALRWIQMSRELAGDGSPAKEASSRGLSVLFPGYHATPDVLVRKLLLDGSGTAGGTPFEFTGQIDDLTPQAKRHSRPMTAHIQAKGAIDLIAKATLDRRQEIPTDHYLVDIPAIQQSGQTLGDPREFAVELAPGTAAIQADIRVIDQDLQGWITINQQQLNLTPHLGPKYAKYLTGDRLKGLRDIDEFAAKISISGPLKRPRWKLESDLGARLASSLNAAVQEELAGRQRELIDQGNQIVDRELGELQENLMDDHRQLLKSLELGDEQLDLIKQQLMAKAGSPDQIIGQGKKLLEMFK